MGRHYRYALFALTLVLWQSAAGAQDVEPSPAADATAPPEINLFGQFAIPGALTTTLTYSTRYISRGFDINKGRATPQLYAEYDHPDGFYAGFFASRANYFGIRAEMDYTLGYRSTLGGLSYDAGYYYYYYPNVPRELHVSYHELGLKLAYDSGAVSPFVEAYISNDYFFASGRSLFLNAGPDIKLPWDVLGAIRVGHIFLEDKRKFLYPPYTVWTAALSKDLFDLNFGVLFSATTIKFNQCLETDVCGNKFTFHVSKSF